MAKIENIDGASHVNVSASVGRNGVNNESDVIAVQALMKFALEGRAEWQGIRFPEPTGTMDKKTFELIKHFQRHQKKNSKRGKIDGRIDPAKGLFVNGGANFWTICALNVEAMESWAVWNRIGRDHIHAIGLLFPAFKAAVGDKGVGTLNLELEGSSNGVGTLGLELE